MKCCDITAGKLKALITIERATQVPDGEGGFTETWAADPVDGVYALVKPLTGSERFFAERLQPSNRIRFIVRFRGDSENAPYYSAKDRIVYKGRTFGIEGVTDIEDAEKWLDIMAVENKAS